MSKKNYIIPIFLSVFCLCSTAQNKALNTFIKSTQLKYASVGIKVVDLESGNTVCKHNESQALTPASTLKLLTTASALEILGEDYKFKTSLYAVGNIDASGTLSGFLFINGSGDPCLGSEHLNSDKEAFLQEWFTALQQAGIKRITGGIRVSNVSDCYEPMSAKWILEDAGNYFAAEIYPISVFDNTYRIYLKSGLAGTSPEITRVEPNVDLTFNNYLKAASNNQDSAYIRGLPSYPERSIYGTIPANKNNFVVKGAIPQPPVFLAEYFKKFLSENGIKVEGDASAIQRKTNEGDKLLKTIYSKPISEIVRITNFKSNNHYAEALFYAIGKEKTTTTDCSYIPKQSAIYIKNFWKLRGVDTSGAFVYDGSGLSPANGIPAGLLTDLLVYMNQKSTLSRVFYNTLPKAGQEGTVTNFLKTKRSDVLAHVKSGSISNVQSYAGYIDKNGKKYAFAIIVNNFTGNRAALRNQIEDFLLDF